METERTCIIVNPRAGRQRATKRLHQSYPWAIKNHRVLYTQRSGDARRMARESAEQGSALVIAAGGDGTVHEVACGLLECGNQECTLGVMPLGSANDFAWSLRREASLAETIDVDAGHIETVGGKTDYFIESVGLGLSGRVTLAARSIGWLQGMPLYMLAAFMGILRIQSHSHRLVFDGQEMESATTLLSLMIGKREGSFVLAPDASMSDGKFDFLHAVDIRFWEALLLLPRIALAGPPRGHKKIQMGQCQTLHVHSQSELVIHTDGELFATPGDGVFEVQITLIPKRLKAKLF